MVEKKYVVADHKGAITKVISGAVQYIEVPVEDDVSDLTNYVKDGGIFAKEYISFSEKVDGLSVTLTGLPEGVTVIANGWAILVDSEPTVVEFDAPGEYLIEIDGGLYYLSDELEVTVG